MFLPVNGKTVTFSVLILVALFAAGRLLPAESWDFVRNNDLAVWAVGLVSLYAIYNVVAGSLTWLIIRGSGFVFRKFINPEVGRTEQKMMDGHGTYETIYYKDGTEEHFFHFDQNHVRLAGDGN
jgi:hypothetical protein